MVIPSFMLNPDLTSLLITLAGQSILVSVIGVITIKLLSGKSAPVCSLVCTSTIAAMGLVIVFYLGLLLSGVSWSQTTISVTGETQKVNSQLSPGSGNELPFIPMSPVTWIQPIPSHEMANVDSILMPTTYSGFLALPVSVYINFFGLIWLIGILFHLSRLGYGVALVNNFRKRLKNTRDIPLNDMARNIPGTFRNKRLPALYSSSLIESPITIGLFNPVVIIPKKLLATLSENELKSILLHEIAHIYHYDQAVGVVKRILLAFYWWNPLAYEVNRNHEQAREEVSDNYVLSELNPKVYTQCLMNLAEKVCLIGNFPTAVSMAGRHFNLRARVEKILSKKRIIAIRTGLYLKAVTFSICFSLSFWIAGLHAHVIMATALHDSAKKPRTIWSALKKGQIEDAVADFNKAIEIYPDYAAAYQNRGSVYCFQGRFDDAVSDYNKAIDINPDLSASYIDRGSIYQLQGKIDDAISDFSRALALNPEDPETYHQRNFCEKACTCNYQSCRP
jgi:beta-lactamase regulating signal transducer with metallopeptidase domain